ncbi:MAG TPA: hypothetical protein VGI43_09280 [Mucilaginibacter sp.]|jgi:predicted heme/steroid binding protein
MNKDKIKTEEPVRNPFGVHDVPNPDSDEVLSFASDATFLNAQNILKGKDRNEVAVLIAGKWNSRWNGGADKTIKDDAPGKWKAGEATIQIEINRVYILFNWKDGERQGLIDAGFDEDNRMIGRYINLSDLSIMRPWKGVLADKSHIAGNWTNGILEFYR